MKVISRHGQPVFTLMIVEESTQVNGKGLVLTPSLWLINTENTPINGLMEVSIRESGKTVKEMGKAPTLGLMEANTSGNTRKVTKMDKALSHIQMGIGI